MKTLILTALCFMALNTQAGIVPRINCIGSEYDKKLLLKEEVQEEKVLLEYRSGGAAFANVFFGELKDKTFIVLLDKSYPISNFEATPVTMGIYETLEGKVLAEKKALLLANGVSTKVEVLLKNKILTLSCSRLANP